MDLTGRTNMDLSEAARLMKPSTTTSTGVNPAQMQTPPLMMMQQAVAMQQFQFQQALLMQQVMASQQAAARAATVKSAAEMAAARAAEISKQLKGSSAEDEEKKPTSPNRSRSPSRSKSRSPIRYRRDRSRSLSRSPIRYRRDRPFSPSRSRDHYSYRSRSRRGYYRGRGDFPWNPFRREWDRDRDRDYYPRSRRSRSRSRVRRRSRSGSRSPRFRRERSFSPRHRREERKPTRSSRRSRSRELKRTPSVSSRSPSASPRRKDGSKSPQKKAQESDISPIRRAGSGSPVPPFGRRVGRDLSASPRDNQTRSPDFKRDERLKKKGLSLERDKESVAPRVETSVSLRRSPSVSLSPSLREGVQSDEEEDIISNLKRSTSNRVPPKEEVKISAPVRESEADIVFPSQSAKKGSGSDISSEGAVADFKPKEQFLGKQIRTSKGGERSSRDGGFLAGDESEDEELDDWRDDMKAHSREKLRRKDQRRDHDRKLEVDSRFSKVEVTHASSRDAGFLAVQESEEDRKVRTNTGGARERRQESSRETWDINRSSKKQIGDRSLGETKWQESSRGKVRDLYDVKEDDADEVQETGVLKHMGGKEYTEDPRKEKAGDSPKEDERDFEEEVIFEGPKPEAEEYEEVVETARPAELNGYKDTEVEVDRIQAPVYPRARDDSDVEEEEELKLARGKLLVDEEDVVVSRKGKEKSRSKDRRLEDEEEREKRKERHRKHRKKHRREAEDGKDEVEEDNDDIEGRKERRRNKRKHRKEDEDERRERRKRKHKSRGKSGSDSAGESPRAIETRGDSPRDKKSSSRHRKRRRDPSKSPANSGSSSE